MIEPIKMGISFGQMKGERMYKTDITNPAYACKDANNFLHDKMNMPMSVYFVDENQRGRRRSRRRV
jgi:hypothetical protein